MAFTANVFTPSAIGAALFNEQLLLETSRMTELSQEIVAGQAILMHQDPNLVTTGFGESCINAKVYTLRSDSLDKGDKVVACAVSSGVKAGSEALTLTKESLVNIEHFAIDDILCANAVDFGTQFAYLSLKAKIGLEVKLSKALVALAAANVDTPDAAWFEVDGTVNGDIYEIAAADFTADVLADLQWTMKAADMISPIIVNGRNFFNKSILNQFESAGCCTNDAILNRNQVFSIYWDAKNVDSVTGASSSLVIDKNALLFWSSPAYSNIGIETMMTAGEEPADRYHYVDVLPRLQYFANGQMNPIYVDVRAERACSMDSLVPRNGWKFQMMLHGALTANLANQDGLQGIVRIDKIAGV